ncbi:MAG TPA: hypothetical protein VKA84_25250 [Gemmatimonadaceae bacterium]|nr:hypothetical protein [Gemmatimonadaceae bacterium]
MTEGAPAAAPDTVWDGDQSVPTSLPLLDAYLEERAAGARPLEGMAALLIQHQLGSIVPMTRALIALGLSPKRLFWVDIPYTANETVKGELLALGIPARNFAASSYHLEMPYASYQRRRVQQMALRLRRLVSWNEPMLVMDDGAYFLEAVSCFAGSPGELRIVEQTTRGIIKINADMSLRDCCESVTVLNVAQSAPKKNIEGPLIGQAVCHALLAKLHDRERDVRGSPCLVIGFGQIGRGVAAALVEQLGVPPSRIHVLELSEQACADAAAQGYVVWGRAFPERRRFGLVVGCSGTTSFNTGDRVFLEDGAVLASASSGSSELSREAFIELADTHGRDHIFVHDRGSLRSRSIHSDLWVRLVDRDVCFLNGGFPVNFDGAVNCVPPRFIQATHALQVGAAVEAVRTTSRGLVDVSDDLCRWVERRFAELVGH